jgi:drug/metabolite transporter (DMT)-like permease
MNTLERLVPRSLPQQLTRDSYASSRPFPNVLPKATGAGFAIASAAFYGLSFVLTKGGLQQIQPTLLITIESLASVLFMSLLILVQKRRFPNLILLLKLGTIGIFEPGLAYIVVAKGLVLTTASNATVISALEPIVTLGLACVLLRERISVAKLSIAVISIVGVCLISSAAGGTPSLLGDLLILVGVLFASLYAIATERSFHIAEGIDPLMVAWAQQLIALLFFVGLTVLSITHGIEPLRLSSFAPSALLTAITAGIVGHGLAFLLYLNALRYLSASDTSLYLSLIPVFGTTAAVLFLGERLSWDQGVGALLVVLSIAALARVESD